MRVPVAYVVQPGIESFLDLSLLGSAVGPKTEPAAEITLPRSRCLLDTPVVPSNVCEQLSASLSFPARGLPVRSDMQENRFTN